MTAPKRARTKSKQKVTRTGKSAVRIHTTALGIEITLLPISPLLLMKLEEVLEREIGRPVRPVYITHIGEGEHTAVQELPHDESTLTTVEELEEWKAYKKHFQQWEEMLQKKMLEAIVLEGVQFEMPDNDDWVGRQERLGIKVPTDKVDRLIHYFETKVIGSYDDLIEILMMSMTAGGVDAETKKAASNLFRNQIQTAFSNAGNITG